MSRRRVRPGDARPSSTVRSTSRAGSTPAPSSCSTASSRLRHGAGLDYTLFRPFNWIGPGLDSIFESKEGSLARRNPVPRPDRARRADPARRRRPPEARLRRHRRRRRRADADHREPRRRRQRPDLQHRQPGEPLVGARARGEMLAHGAHDYPEYASAARGCRIVETLGQDFYGHGYQDVQDRCRRSTPPCATSAGGRRSPWSVAAAASSSRIGARWRTPGALDSYRLSAGRGVDRSQGRRRHAARHPRGRAAPVAGCSQRRRARHVPVQPGSGSHRLGAAPRLSSVAFSAR